MGTKKQTADANVDAEGAAVPDTLPATPADATEAPDDGVTVEDWRALRQPPAWAHMAAVQLRNWPIGKVLTADEYDSAIKAAQTIEVS